MSYSANQPGEQVSIYDQVGGEETFDKLTRRFYALVKAETILTISMHRRDG